MRRALAAFAASFAAVVIAACGTPPKQHPPAPKTIQGHPCRPGDEAQQCVLPPPPAHLAPPPAPIASTHTTSSFAVAASAPRTVRGIDFAWGAPTAGALRANGWQFGTSYLSYDASKGWAQRAGLISEYHRAGIATVMVWETAANRAAQGCAAGQADAREASRQAAQLGNTNRPIDFAIDFDATGGQVDGYFRCAHGLLGSRVNAYGGYRPLAYLCAHGLVGHTNWQTYAWSGGAWLSPTCAPLEQWLNGNTVDYDRALAADYGQSPAPAVIAVTRRHLEEGLWRLYRERNGVNSNIAAYSRLLTKHACRHGHPKPRSYRHTCAVWKQHGDQSHTHLAQLEAQIKTQKRLIARAHR